MKKIYTILTAVLITATTWAQTPEKMSYQSVVRNASDQLLTNQDMGIQISILQGSTSGTPVYVETHSTASNANGLVTIEIGAGTTSDDFSAIDWTSGPYFLKTETDPTTSSGTNYSITGTSQLLSVPYALHSNTADTVTGTISETDPIFDAWNKSTGISITESQISNLNHFTNADETDPIFGTSVASGITGADTTNWNNKLDMEVDGSVTNEIQDLELTDNILTITNNVLATQIDLSDPNVYSPETDTLFVVKDNDGNLVFAIFPDGATAIGFGSVTNAKQSMAIGVRDTASAENSLAMGVGSNATGLASIAIGSYVEANTTGTFVVGQLNKPFGTTDLWNTSDPIFVVGNGIFGIPGYLSTAIRSNAFTILKNGNMGVGIDTPQRKVHIKDVMRLEPRLTAPLNPSEGDMYFDGVDKKLMVYDGSIWQACW